MLYLSLTLLTLLIVGADQLTKSMILHRFSSYVITYLATGTPTAVAPTDYVPVLDGIVHWTFWPNDGAAFSIGEGQTWIFILATFAFFVLVAVALKKKWIEGTALWGLAMVVGGGIGNLIDRMFRGFVVDMIEVEFLSFPVFNVADCFITVGGIILVLAILFEGKKTEDKQ